MTPGTGNLLLRQSPFTRHPAPRRARTPGPVTGGALQGGELTRLRGELPTRSSTPSLPAKVRPASKDGLVRRKLLSPIILASTGEPTPPA